MFIFINIYIFNENKYKAQYPAIITYHSTEPGSAPFSNIAWAGFVGIFLNYVVYNLF